jgi:hypothetical protein
MSQLDTLREALLKLMSKYPVDSYEGAVTDNILIKRVAAEYDFMINEKEIIHKISMAVLNEGNVSLDEIQEEINNTIKRYFRITEINKPARKKAER